MVIATNEINTYIMFNYEWISWITHLDNYDGLNGPAAYVIIIDTFCLINDFYKQLYRNNIRLDSMLEIRPNPSNTPHFHRIQEYQYFQRWDTEMVYKVDITLLLMRNSNRDLVLIKNLIQIFRTD